MEDKSTKRFATVLEDIRHPDAAVEREWASVPVAQAIMFSEDPTMARTLKTESALEGRQICVPDYEASIESLIHDGDATGFIGGKTYKISVGTRPCLYYSDSTGPMTCEWISTILAVNGDSGNVVYERDVRPEEVESVLRRILTPAPIDKVEKKLEPEPAADTTPPPIPPEEQTATEATETNESTGEKKEDAEAQELVEKVDVPEQVQEPPQPEVRITLLDRTEKRGKSRRTIAMQKKLAEEERRKREAEQALEEANDLPPDVIEERDQC